MTEAGNSILSLYILPDVIIALARFQFCCIHSFRDICFFSPTVSLHCSDVLSPSNCVEPNSVVSYNIKIQCGVIIC